MVSLALQVAVNYANDYSDGVRGTDDDRVGPFRLTGSRAARPGAVKAAAFAAFAVAAVAGLAARRLWRAPGGCSLVGALAIVAAWFYTGGSRPYGYLGLGEVFVFVFFGLVAVLGTTYTQAGRLSWLAWAAAVAIGSLACAILVANNLRDIPTDAVAGKRTLAVRLGDARTRALYGALVVVPLAAGASRWRRATRGRCSRCCQPCCSGRRCVSCAPAPPASASSPCCATPGAPSSSTGCCSVSASPWADAGAGALDLSVLSSGVIIDRRGGRAGRRRGRRAAGSSPREARASTKYDSTTDTTAVASTSHNGSRSGAHSPPSSHSATSTPSRSIRRSSE